MIFNNRGFSLVQALAAAAIGMVGMFALMTTTTSSLRANKNVENQSAITDFISELRLVLRDEPTCAANINNFNPKILPALPADLATFKMDISQIRYTDNSVIATAGQALPNVSAIKLNKFEINTIRPLSGTKYLGKIEIQLEKLGEHIGAKYLPSKFIPIHLKVDAARAVVNCSVSEAVMTDMDMEEIAAQICASLGGTYDSVAGTCSGVGGGGTGNYPGGHVGTWTQVAQGTGAIPAQYSSLPPCSPHARPISPNPANTIKTSGPHSFTLETGSSTPVYDTSYQTVIANTANTMEFSLCTQKDAQCVNQMTNSGAPWRWQVHRCRSN